MIFALRRVFIPDVRSIHAYSCLSERTQTSQIFAISHSFLQFASIRQVNEIGSNSISTNIRFTDLICRTEKIGAGKIGQEDRSAVAISRVLDREGKQMTDPQINQRAEYIMRHFYPPFYNKTKTILACPLWKDFALSCHYPKGIFINMIMSENFKCFTDWPIQVGPEQNNDLHNQCLSAQWLGECKITREVVSYFPHTHAHIKLFLLNICLLNKRYHTKKRVAE